MSVSLCAFRLELGCDSVIPQGFNYLGILRIIYITTAIFNRLFLNVFDLLLLICIAPHYQTAMDTPVENLKSKMSTSDKCRGKRELQDIEIETYENEDKDENAGTWVGF